MERDLKNWKNMKERDECLGNVNVLGFFTKHHLSTVCRKNCNMITKYQFETSILSVRHNSFGCYLRLLAVTFRAGQTQDEDRI